MNKHLTFEQRVQLEYMLNTNTYGGATKLAKKFDVARNTIYYEIKKAMVIKRSSSELYGTRSSVDFCERLRRFPFVCNGCVKTSCTHRSRFYKAYVSDNESNKLLHSSRINKDIRKRNIKILNESVCPLIKNGVSIEIAVNSVNNCDLSVSTIRRYIELGLLTAKRIDLPRAVRFRAKKEYNYKTPPLDINILYGRTYNDYLKYMTMYPKSRVIQLDSVIGKSSDKYAILTIFFKNSKLQLGKLYHRKNNNVIEILRKLYKVGIDNNEKLFDVVLADNGTEFKTLHNLEKDEEGNTICKVFFCDPYRSCQKAECEKNHGFFRRILAKGKSLDLYNQENIDEIFSHINSYPRTSLKNKSPFEIFNLEYNPIILFLQNIKYIKLKDIRLKDYKLWGKR